MTIIKILAVCGMGLGSGLVLRMQVEKALKSLGVEADVEVSDVPTARGMNPDIIVTSSELSEALGDMRAQIVTIKNYVDQDEMQQKLKPALDAIE
jgi:PTS system ascorbate-specific IIB component